MAFHFPPHDPVHMPYPRVAVWRQMAWLLLTAPLVAAAQGSAASAPAAPASAKTAASGNAKAGATIASQGVPPAVVACASCHGAKGEGMADFPPLAGQGANYLTAQLQAFAQGSRANAIMAPIAKGLSAQQQADVAAHYASLPSQLPTARRDRPAAQPSDAGAWLVERGRWSDQIPACASCHGPTGAGVGPAFPAIGHLSAAYMQTQIDAWKKGQRPAGPLGLMEAVAKRLSPDDVRAVATYYQGLRATPAAQAAAPARAPASR